MLVSLLKVIRKVGSFRKVKVARTKGTTNKKTTVAWEFAKEASYINPTTGKKMPQKELRHSIAKKADQSPRIFNLLLVIDLGSGMHNCIKGTQCFLLMNISGKLKNWQVVPKAGVVKASINSIITKYEVCRIRQNVTYHAPYTHPRVG